MGTWKKDKRPKAAHRTKKTTIKHTGELATRINRRPRKQNKDREAIPSVKPKNNKQSMTQETTLERKKEQRGVRAIWKGSEHTRAKWKTYWS